MRDKGRQQAYRAEAAAMGGHWYSTRCEIPTLDRVAFLELHGMAVDYCRDTLGVRRAPPDVKIRARRNSACFGNKIVYASHGLRAQTPLHEVAHWAAPSNFGHGPEWRRVYAALIREFLGEKFADAFVRELEVQPIRKTFAVETRPEGSDHWSEANTTEAKYVRAKFGRVLREGHSMLVYSAPDRYSSAAWFRMVETKKDF